MYVLHLPELSFNKEILTIKDMVKYFLFKLSFSFNLNLQKNFWFIAANSHEMPYIMQINTFPLFDKREYPQSVFL
jgi:hypothetical protein